MVVAIITELVVFILCVSDHCRSWSLWELLQYLYRDMTAVRNTVTKFNRFIFELKLTAGLKGTSVSVQADRTETNRHFKKSLLVFQ